MMKSLTRSCHVETMQRWHAPGFVFLVSMLGRSLACSEQRPYQALTKAPRDHWTLHDPWLDHHVFDGPSSSLWWPLGTIISLGAEAVSCCQLWTLLKHSVWQWPVQSGLMTHESWVKRENYLLRLAACEYGFVSVLCRSTLDEICGTACSIRSTPQYRSVMRRVTLCCWNSEWCHSTSSNSAKKVFFPNILFLICLRGKYLWISKYSIK